MAPRSSSLTPFQPTLKKGLLVPCHYQAAEEQPDNEFPYILNTGRLLEHWHTGSMTRRSRALSQLQPHAFAAMNPAELTALGLTHGERVRVSSRRGEIELAIRADASLDHGILFIPFHFREAAANFSDQRHARSLWKNSWLQILCGQSTTGLK